MTTQKVKGQRQKAKYTKLYIGRISNKASENAAMYQRTVKDFLSNFIHEQPDIQIAIYEMFDSGYAQIHGKVPNEFQFVSWFTLEQINRWDIIKRFIRYDKEKAIFRVVFQ